MSLTWSGLREHWGAQAGSGTVHQCIGCNLHTKGNLPINMSLTWSGLREYWGTQVGSKRVHSRIGCNLLPKGNPRKYRKHVLNMVWPYTSEQ